MAPVQSLERYTYVNISLTLTVFPCLTGKHINIIQQASFIFFLFIFLFCFLLSIPTYLPSALNYTPFSSSLFIQIFENLILWLPFLFFLHFTHGQTCSLFQVNVNDSQIFLSNSGQHSLSRLSCLLT